MDSKDKKIEAQIISYLCKVIHHTAINFYKKRKRLKKKESLLENVDYHFLYPDAAELDLPTLEIFGYPFKLDDEKIIKRIKKLSDKEKVFLIEKFVLGKTDKEIGVTLGITRQGVTNLKLRMYKKLRS